jgi:hypothetical protein
VRLLVLFVVVLGACVTRRDALQGRSGQLTVFSYVEAANGDASTTLRLAYEGVWSDRTAAVTLATLR